MKISVHHSCDEAESYRAARVKSLFNVESGATFDLDAELPIEDLAWRLGVIVGPSGAGKSSLGQRLWGQDSVYTPDWPDAPIIDAVAPGAAFDDVTAALAAVGLGSVPTWLRPYRVLSNGERFRADLARLVAGDVTRVVVDEFSSVVDRQIARVGAMAFGKAWRRRPVGQALLLSCHYDIIDWLQPDWVLDLKDGRFHARWRRRRPAIELEIRETDWRWWPHFEPHHYLKLPKMIAARCYVAFVNDEPVAHVAFSTRPGMLEARACRLVVMPEWQGAGVGMRFLNAVCGRWRAGKNRFGLRMPTLFHTSHPGLAAALRRDRSWTQVSAVLHGDNRERSKASIARSAVNFKSNAPGAGFGGHFRAVQGFRYIGEAT
ncbi:MAG: ABC transporter ATP-binding protein [Rhodospirillaceae bacterium]|nr:ABC transporter ATP-binding protein [Rhodospirillaceae bacterium]